MNKDELSMAGNTQDLNLVSRSSTLPCANILIPLDVRFRPGIVSSQKLIPERIARSFQKIMNKHRE